MITPQTHEKPTNKEPVAENQPPVDQPSANAVKSELDALAGKREEDVTYDEARVRQGNRDTWNYRTLFLSTLGAGIVLLIIAFAWPDGDSQPQRPNAAGAEIPSTDVTAPADEDGAETPES